MNNRIMKNKKDKKKKTNTKKGVNKYGGCELLLSHRGSLTLISCLQSRLVWSGKMT